MTHPAQIYRTVNHDPSRPNLPISSSLPLNLCASDPFFLSLVVLLSRFQQQAILSSGRRGPSYGVSGTTDNGKTKILLLKGKEKEFSAAKIVKQFYSVIPVYDKIIHAIFTGVVWNLPKICNFSPGVPVGPMLAKPTKGVSEIVDKFNDMEFTCEYKYGG